ncbi:MAG: hydrogenase maturation factor [Lachnospiraceae bacterium]|jgi:hydrogenase expression/formation protein HypE|nr:hydrogenase maturation factor [Lachnospiraceae bacterium]
MKVGKVSETILKRSIFKQIRTKREEVLLGAGVGEDCAAVKLSPGEVFVLSTDPITGTIKDVGNLAIQVTVNDLASSGAEPVGVMLTVLLPKAVTEEDIREMMSQVEEACSVFQIQVMGGHTEVTAAVAQPVISVTGVGKAREDQLISTAGAKVGQDILVTKWIGIEGTSIIAKEKEEELGKRFSKSFVETAKGFDQYLSVLPEARLAVKLGVSAMHDVTEGGIYGALWELAEASGIGLEIDLKAIPIRQETVEVCEHFGLNPYYLISSGCMLMAGDRGHDLVRELKKAGIPAAVIGKAVEGKARRILNGEEEAFLERPRTDELYKIYQLEQETEECGKKF